MRRLLVLLVCAGLSLLGSPVAAQPAGSPTARPAEPRQRTDGWVFAVNTATRSIVRMPVDGGRATTVAPRRTAWAVNTAGDVYVVDRKAKRVTRTPADGSPVRRLGSGFTDPTDVQLDGKGRVYVVDGRRVVRMSPTGRRQRVVAQPVSPAVFVRADGAVSTTTGDGQDSALTILTYPAGGGRPRTRTLTGQGEWGPFEPSRGNLLGDGAGNLFLHWVSTGASGFAWWFRVPAGGSTPALLYTREASYAVAVDPANRFYLAQTARFCDSISVNEGSCVPDPTVAEILRFEPDGSDRGIAITPFSYDPAGAHSAATLAADGTGHLFVAQSAGPSAGLLKYEPTGGDPVLLASGTFTEPKRNN
ncbi:MAG: hypothetical protein ACJ72K_01640 [Friedmanniella sp.]